MLAGDVNYVCTFHDSEDGFCEDGKSGKSWISKFMLIKMDVSVLWRYKYANDLLWRCFDTDGYFYLCISDYQGTTIQNDTILQINE